MTLWIQFGHSINSVLTILKVSKVEIFEGKTLSSRVQNKNQDINSSQGRMNFQTTTVVKSWARSFFEERIYGQNTRIGTKKSTSTSQTEGRVWTPDAWIILPSQIKRTRTQWVTFTSSEAREAGKVPASGWNQNKTGCSRQNMSQEHINCSHLPIPEFTRDSVYQATVYINSCQPFGFPVEDLSSKAHLRNTNCWAFGAWKGR